MTESDVLARAAKALREAHTGEREGSGFTRARIMNSMHRERRGRTLRWAVLSPLASVLLVGSAWAQSAGKWPVIWKAVTSVFVAAPPPSPPSSSPPTSSSSRRLREETGRARGEQGAADSGADEMSPAPLPEPTERAEPRLGSAPEEAERGRQPARRRARRSAPSGSGELESGPAAPAHEAPAEPEHDRELGSFRNAHDLHFKGRAGDAIEAYAQYLRQYPRGRFVPEARYAQALDYIKLGNDAAAREALAPFAAGRYGSYRQKEARTLLGALDAKKKPARP